MGNTRVVNWGNTPLLLDLQTRCNAPGRSYTWTACDMRSTHVPLRTHSSALCNTGQHPRGRGPPPETRSRLWPMVFGLWLVIIVWCHFMVGGARAEIQYISSAPSVLTPIRLLTISHDFARSLHPSRLLEGFCGVRAPQSSERRKILYSRILQDSKHELSLSGMRFDRISKWNCIRKFSINTIEPPYEQIQSGIIR